MAFRAYTMRRVALVVLLAFVGVRLADAHLHICVDGTEPPVAVHAAEGASHDDSHEHQTDHEQDRDVQPFDGVLPKGGPDADVFLVAVALFVVPLTQSQPGPRTPLLAQPFLRPPSELKPPLRGPPP